MASQALESWQVQRALRLDELVHAHGLVGGSGPGRRWRTDALNEAMALRLAAEFQGFARDLHDLACDVFAAWVAPSVPGAEAVVRDSLKQGRDLDRGNAHPGSIGKDFGRFRIDVWPALAARDATTAAHNRTLDRLNRARNAVAHSDDAVVAGLRSEGFPLTLRTFRSWRRDLDRLADNLDAEIAQQLGRLFGRAAPW
ncbi:MAG: hypothetical protein M0013_05950 [Actinomycetota bacterium]|nr:hypothetical protein [Actinomycetota bacterium]